MQWKSPIRVLGLSAEYEYGLVNVFLNNLLPVDRSVPIYLDQKLKGAWLVQPGRSTGKD